VDGTGSGSCAAVGLGISSVAGPWDHYSRRLINRRVCMQLLEVLVRNTLTQFPELCRIYFDCKFSSDCSLVPSEPEMTSRHWASRDQRLY